MRLASAPPTTTPAEQFVQQARWLLGTRSVVVDLVPEDDHTVRLVVADPFATNPEDREHADHLAADSALSVLEQAAHGVRLITSTRDGYTGRLRALSPVQLTFLTGLPGVQRADLVPQDLDGDGSLGPEEAAYRVDVDTAEDAQRVDWLLLDRFTSGTVQPGPVQISVPERPFRPSWSSTVS